MLKSTGYRFDITVSNKDIFGGSNRSMFKLYSFIRSVIYKLKKLEV